MTLDVAAHFSPQGIYLNTATVGLPCQETLEAMQQDTLQWQQGKLDVPGYDALIDRCRKLFGQLIHVPADWVSIGNQVAPFVTLLAQSLKPGTRILAPDNDFTSVLFPFLLREHELDMVLVPQADIPERLESDQSFDWVALSAVQSADGVVAELDSISRAATQSGTKVLLDATHAVSWLDIQPGHWDMLICGAYKWLLSPRGTAFMAIKPELMADIPPIMANWYAGDDIWQSIYGAPLRLAESARRYDISPAWSAWVGTLPALELINSFGVAAIGEHNVGLANRFRLGIGLAESNSAIVSLNRAGVDEKLQAAGIDASVRAGSARLSFHFYNTEQDVDRALQVIVR